MWIEYLIRDNKVVRVAPLYMFLNQIGKHTQTLSLSLSSYILTVLHFSF